MINKEDTIKQYIENINKINAEIKAIKSADCIMDYDAKTESINLKMRVIQTLDMGFEMTATAGV